MDFSTLLKSSIAALGNTAEFKGLCSAILAHSPKARAVLIDVLSTLVDAPASTLTTRQVGQVKKALLDGYSETEVVKS